jgi:hypothetical protein
VRSVSEQTRIEFGFSPIKGHLGEIHTGEILAIEPQQIECVECDWRSHQPHVEALQQLKRRSVFVVQCDNLAVNNCVTDIERSD